MFGALAAWYRFTRRRMRVMIDPAGRSIAFGSRVRARFRLLEYKALDGGAQLTMEATLEREGGERPVCVAETVSRRYTTPPGA